MKAKSKQQQAEKKENKHKKEQKTKHEHREGYKPRKREEEERERLTRRMLEEAARLAHSDASKTFRGDVWRQGIGQIAGMRHFPKPLFAGFGGGGPGTASLVGAQWTQVGPAPLRVTFSSGPGPVAGRVYDIAIDPSGASDQKIYLATLGGIWKSTDGGASWAPKDRPAFLESDERGWYPDLPPFPAKRGYDSPGLRWQPQSNECLREPESLIHVLAEASFRA